MADFEMNEFLGKPVLRTFNPPGCPIQRYGEPINMSTAPIHAYANDTFPGGDETEIWFVFGNPDEASGHFTNYVETDTLDVQQDDSLAAMAHELKGNEQDPRLERIREAFANRTRHCPGVRNGECWALGSRAVKQVISNVDTTT